MVFDWLFGKEEDSFIPDSEMVLLPERSFMSRREFLQLSLLGAAAYLLNACKDGKKYVTITITTKPPTNSFSGAVGSVCDWKKLMKHFGVTSRMAALQKLGQQNGIRDINVVRAGQRIRIPRNILKRGARSFLDRKKVDESEKVKDRKKGFGPQNNYKLQSPFGGRTLPILHKCSQQTPQNRSKREGMHRTCPFDLYGAGRVTKGKRRPHKGHDFYCKVGTKLYPLAPGRVVKTGRTRSNGKYVKIQSGKFVYFYLHMSKIKVRRGERVRYGTLVGLSGITGNRRYGRTNPHLHLQLSYNSKIVNPLRYLRFMIN